MSNGGPRPGSSIEVTAFTVNPNWPRAKDALLTAAIASEEQLGEHEPAEDLLTMEGMDRHLAYILASREIITMEDLAEQGVDDLLDIEDMTEERAGELILTARAPWFAAAEAEAAAAAEQ